MPPPTPSKTFMASGVPHVSQKPLKHRLPYGRGSVTRKRPVAHSHHSGGANSWGCPLTVSVYFTRPRRTSSMEVTVGFLDVVGRNGRAPLDRKSTRLNSSHL